MKFTEKLQKLINSTPIKDFKNEQLAYDIWLKLTKYNMEKNNNAKNTGHKA